MPSTGSVGGLGLYNIIVGQRKDQAWQCHMKTTEVCKLYQQIEKIYQYDMYQYDMLSIYVYISIYIYIYVYISNHIYMLRCVVCMSYLNFIKCP